MSVTKEIKINKIILLLVTSLACFSASLLATAVSVALPSIGKEFPMGVQLLGWLVTSFVLSTAVVMVPVGRIADIYGRNKIFSYGLLLFVVSAFLCAISPSAILLIPLLIVQGIAAAMIWSPAVAMLASYFSAAERGKAIGINTGAIYCGLSVGPFWGGFLTEALGWRSIFSITAVLVAVAAVLAFWKLKGEWGESRGEKLDISGSAALIISLILILYGFSAIPGFISIPFILLGFLGILVFYRIEIKTANPVLNVSLFRNNRVFVFSLLGILLVYCATFAPAFLLSLYLQYNKGFSPATAGAILVIQPAVMAALAPVSGRVSDKVEPLRVSLFGMGVVCIALVLFSFLSDGSSLWFIFTGLTVMGIGFGFFAAPVMNAVVSSVDKKFFGVASGTVAALRHSGQVFSMGIVMILFTIYIGNVQITPQYYAAFLHSLKAAFIIFAALCGGGILALLAANKAKQSI